MSVSKTTGSGNQTVFHEFECDGIPCTSRNITLEHLSFDSVLAFTDVSTVALSGTVSIAGTKDNNNGFPCGIDGVTACAIFHYGRNEDLICRTADVNGADDFVWFLDLIRIR